jgi:hypothetical protein
MMKTSKIYVIYLHPRIFLIDQKSRSIKICIFFLQNKRYIIHEIQEFKMTNIKDIFVRNLTNQLFIGNLNLIYLYSMH